MTRDPAPLDDRPDGAPAGSPAGEPIDDLTLAALVRDVADDWRLPAQRLDQPTWWDRVTDSERGRRRGRFGRLAGAAVAAVLATVVLSVFAAWIALPRDGSQSGKPGNPASTGSGASPTSHQTAQPTAAALPKLMVNGPLPTVTRVPVLAGAGFVMADLTSGSLGPRSAKTVGDGLIHRLPGGGYACLCVETAGFTSGAYLHATVRLIRYDDAGTAGTSAVVGDYSGIPDPRPGIKDDYPPNVDIAISYSPDGRFGYVGWSARKPPVWQTGVVVVDLVAGSVVQRMALPDVSTGPDAAIHQAFGPRVAVAPDGGRILVWRNSYWVDAATTAYHSGSDDFVATRAGSGSAFGDLAPFATSAPCTDGQADAGLTVTGSWTICYTADGNLVNLRRLAADGTLLGESAVILGGEGDSWLLSGSAIYFWNAADLTATRIDLATGTQTEGTAPRPTAGLGDPLTAFGRWLAPAVAAKVFLQPGLVVSPDGTRLYALGIAAAAGGRTGSTGVLVFDASTLKPLGHWAPLADLTSLAISSDGRFLYAAGSPGVDATGQAFTPWASITVYDTSDGSVRLLAGQLEGADLRFAEPILP